MAVIGEMRQLTIGGKTYTLPTYSLPIASSSTLGGIKVGSGLSIDPSTGTLTATGTSITIDTAMSDSSTNAVLNKVIKSYADGLIAALDGGTIGAPGAGKTLTALSQTNGLVSATFSNISITKSLVSDFPTDVSAFTNDAGYLTSYTETDPVFSASAAAGITNTDITNWNAKSDTDEKLKTSIVASSITQYYPIFGNYDSTSSNKYISGHFRVQYYNGVFTLQLGQISSLSPTRGVIKLISDLPNASVSINTSATADRTIVLPDASGTLALTSNTPALASINSTGLITYKNSEETSLFTLLLPLYNGGVS